MYNKQFTHMVQSALIIRSAVGGWHEGVTLDTILFITFAVTQLYDWNWTWVENQHFSKVPKSLFWLQKCIFWKNQVKISGLGHI